MAHADSFVDQNILKDAILRVWTPTVGTQSLEDLWIKNTCQVLAEMKIDSDEILYDFVASVNTNVGRTNISKCFDSEGVFQLENALVSGSWSEGLFINFESLAEYTPPDVDFMCVLKNIKFTINDQLCGNLPLKEDTPFVNAYVTDKSWKEFLKGPCDQHSSKKHQLSSSKLKEKLLRNYVNVGNFFACLSGNDEHYYSEPGSAAFTVDSGKPAECTPIFCSDSIRFCIVNDALQSSIQDLSDAVKRNLEKLYYRLLPSADIVLALSCDGWPLCAREWITRERIWPAKDLVERITQNGFHIVPKSSSDGDFRLSFSFAETTLIKHLLPLQHKVLRSFKGVVKYYQSTWSPNIKDIITTYHLKTVAFWHFERTEQVLYTEETVATHLVLLLQELAEALRKLNLPMYFMPKVNLFQGYDNYEEAINIVDKIIILSRNYVAITLTVEQLAKVDPVTFIQNFAKSVRMLWEVAKQRRELVDENQLQHASVEGQCKFIFCQLLQFLLNHDDDGQVGGVRHDSVAIVDQFTAMFRNMTDLMIHNLCARDENP